MSESKTGKRRTAGPSPLIPIATAAIVIGIWFWWWPSAADAPIVEGLGQVGDSFGTINALFSGLALAGVVYAIIQQSHAAQQQDQAIRLQIGALELQQEQLQAQLHEMRETRDEMKKVTAANEAQAATTREQVEAMRVSSRLQVLGNLYKGSIDLANSYVGTSHAGDMRRKAELVGQLLHQGLSEIDPEFAERIASWQRPKK